MRLTERRLKALHSKLRREKVAESQTEMAKLVESGLARKGQSIELTLKDTHSNKLLAKKKGCCQPT